MRVSNHSLSDETTSGTSAEPPIKRAARDYAGNKEHAPAGKLRPESFHALPKVATDARQIPHITIGADVRLAPSDGTKAHCQVAFYTRARPFAAIGRLARLFLRRTLQRVLPKAKSCWMHGYATHLHYGKYRSNREKVREIHRKTQKKKTHGKHVKSIK